MTFAELIAEVYLQTNRPDLVNQTTAAVRSATLKLHQISYWDRDLVETGISFSTASFLQSFEYSTLFPRFRALKYIRKSDIELTMGPVLEVVTPDGALDSYKQEKSDVCYLAGSLIQIRSSTLLQYVVMGVYNNPNITVASYTSWIADQHPYAIVHEAARIIFKSIGLQEESAQQEKLVAEQAQLLTISNTVLKGY